MTTNIEQNNGIDPKNVVDNQLKSITFQNAVNMVFPNTSPFLDRDKKEKEKTADEKKENTDKTTDNIETQWTANAETNTINNQETNVWWKKNTWKNNEKTKNKKEKSDSKKWEEKEDKKESDKKTEEQTPTINKQSTDQTDKQPAVTPEINPLDKYSKNNVEDAKTQVKEWMQWAIKNLVTLLWSGILDNEFVKWLAKFFGIEEDSYNDMVKTTLKESFALNDKDGKKAEMIMNAYMSWDKSIITEKNDKYETIIMSPKKIIEQYKNGKERNGTEWKDNTNLVNEINRQITPETIKYIDPKFILNTINGKKELRKEINTETLFEEKTINNKKTLVWKDPLPEWAEETIKKVLKQEMSDPESLLWKSIGKASENIEKNSLNTDDDKKRDRIYSDRDVRRYIATLLIWWEEALWEKITYTELTRWTAWKEKRNQISPDTWKDDNADKMKEKTYTIKEKADIKDKDWKTTAITETELKIAVTSWEPTIKKGNEIWTTEKDNTTDYVETSGTINWTPTTIYIKRDDLTEKPANT